jgi:ADP-ribose pyrophosphatase YjhB (NUDIX family)
MSARQRETVICVGAVVRRDGAILLVRQSKGHSLEGQWTIPWGRLERGESPSLAVLREVSEEAGITASIDGLLGVQELPDPWPGWFALVYLCSHAGGKAAPDFGETDAARYFTRDEWRAWPERKEPWSDWLVMRVFSGDFTLTRNAAGNPLKHDGAFL